MLIYTKDIPDNLPHLDIVDTMFIESGFYDYKEEIPKNTMRNILLAKNYFAKLFPALPAGKLVYFKNENELHILPESGTVIILDLSANITTQLDLLKFYNDTNSNILGTGNITYIDMRNITKGFICTEKITCVKNLVRIYGDEYKNL